MNIDVDFDDCLCETAKHFSMLVKEMFDKDVPYENIEFFNLQKSFDLEEAQYDEMMIRAHQPEILLAYEETPGASETINEWIDKGHNVFIITGRPYSSYQASRDWLDAHNLQRVNLYCLDKYGRESFIKNSEYSLKIEDYYKMHFDYAVEDSPAAFKFFDHLPDLKVMVFDRPWNHETTLPGDNYIRCTNWEQIRELVK